MLKLNGRKFTKCGVLGSGSYGVVYLVSINDTVPQTFYAMKSAPVEESCSLQKELSILENFNGCPEIIQCYGSTFMMDTIDATFNLVLEFAGIGSLTKFMRNNYNGKVPESHVRVYARMLLGGLACIHGKGIVHCDLKPDNILVFPSKDGGFRLKITDFGLAKLPSERSGDHWKGRFRGTPLYMSPESIVDGQISTALDIWSFGCVVTEMLTGDAAWGFVQDNYVLFNKIASGKESPTVPACMSIQGQDFLMKCFMRDPCKRWTAPMLLSHSFLQDKN